MEQPAPEPAVVAERAAPGRIVLIAAVAAVVVALDQLTKSWAVSALSDGTVLHVVGPLDFEYTENPGAAFGIGNRFTPVIVAVSVVVLVAFAVASRWVTTRFGAIAMGLVVGGALGNLFDRFFRDTDGAVVDFISVGWWPTFNVADIGITCGAVLVVLATGRSAE